MPKWAKGTALPVCTAELCY